jgi:deazaflavin-dependent oxidoreductase (nitroreductase family)
MRTSRLKRLLKPLLRVPVYFYRARLGPVFGDRFLLLTHIGRRTGVKHRTVLEVVRYRRTEREAVVMSGFGPKADWLLNIEATPWAAVQVGSQDFIASHRLLGEQEGMAVVADYEQRNWLVRPIIRRVLSALLGWKYRGSDDERRRLVEQLPLIAFRPIAFNLHDKLELKAS